MARRVEVAAVQVEYTWEQNVATERAKQTQTMSNVALDVPVSLAMQSAAQPQSAANIVLDYVPVSAGRKQLPAVQMM